MERQQPRNLQRHSVLRDQVGQHDLIGFRDPRRKRHLLVRCCVELDGDRKKRVSVRAGASVGGGKHHVFACPERGQRQLHFLSRQRRLGVSNLSQRIAVDHRQQCGRRAGHRSLYLHRYQRARLWADRRRFQPLWRLPVSDPGSRGRAHARPRAWRSLQRQRQRSHPAVRRLRHQAVVADVVHRPVDHECKILQQLSGHRDQLGYLAGRLLLRTDHPDDPRYCRRAMDLRRADVGSARERRTDFRLSHEHHRADRAVFRFHREYAPGDHAMGWRDQQHARPFRVFDGLHHQSRARHLHQRGWRDEQHRHRPGHDHRSRSRRKWKRYISDDTGHARIRRRGRDGQGRLHRSALAIHRHGERQLADHYGSAGRRPGRHHHGPQQHRILPVHGPDLYLRRASGVGIGHRGDGDELERAAGRRCAVASVRQPDHHRSGEHDDFERDRQDRERQQRCGLGRSAVREWRAERDGCGRGDGELERGDLDADAHRHGVDRDLSDAARAGDVPGHGRRQLERRPPGADRHVDGERRHPDAQHHVAGAGRSPAGPGERQRLRRDRHDADGERREWGAVERHRPRRRHADADGGQRLGRECRRPDQRQLWEADAQR